MAGGGYALWFVPILFIASIFSFVIQKMPNLLFCVICILIPFISEYLYVYNIVMPWNLSVVPYATFLILCGTMFSKLKFQSRKCLRLLALLVSLCLSIAISKNWRLDLASNMVSPVVMLTVGAFAGALVVSIISLYISEKYVLLKSVLVSIGRETFLIMAFSQLIIMSINYFFSINPYLKYILLLIVLLMLYELKTLIKLCLNILYKTK